MTTEPRASAAGSAGKSKRAVLPSPFPAVVVQLIQQMQNPTVSAAQMGRLIELDPALTASLLRLVNSPFFGLRREIGNVSEAVIVLGMGAARRMVLALGVATPMRQAHDAAFTRTCWLHSVNCAALARCLVSDPATSELAFTCGLLHDIGKMHLLQTHGAAYVQMHADANGGDVRPLEIERFGQAHDVLGADLLEAWGLPQVIADVARHHHAPDATGLTLLQQAVWMANRLAGNPDEAAEAATLPLDTLAAPQQAIEQARAEIASLANVLDA